MAYTIGALVVSAASANDTAQRQKVASREAANVARIDAAAKNQANQLAAEDAATKQRLAVDTAAAQQKATEQMSKAPSVQLSSEPNIRKRQVRAEFALEGGAGGAAPLRV